ncbi:MAG: hypothetical protein H6711_26580 [Myxococcales bacterium]|nr:hypothetical protein [Myxococcales bacterium]
MPARSHRPLAAPLVAAAALLLSACPSWWTTTVGDSESDTGGDTAASTGTGSGTDTDTTGGQQCGDPPAAPACAPQGVSNQVTTLCRARANQADCLAFSDGGSSYKCAWVAIETHPPDDLTCSASVQQYECIGLQVSAAPCNQATCGGAAGTTYYRWNAECQVDVFQASFCGFEVLDWSTCGWTTASSPECTVPWPSVGPAACRCGC